MKLLMDKEAMVLTRQIHQFSEIVAAILGLWPRLSIRGGDFFFVALGVVFPPSLIRMVPTLPLLVARVASVMWDISLTKNGLYRILHVGELVCYVEMVCSSFWSPPPKLVNECLIHGSISEGTYYVGIDGVRELVSFLGKPSDVVPKAFSTLLGAPFQVLGASLSLIGALEVPYKGLAKIGALVDGSGWQVLEPCSCPLREVHGEKLDDEVVTFDSHHATHEEVIF